MIRVQKEDFDIGRELAGLTAGRTDIGGLACFVGLVRDFVESSGGKAASREGGRTGRGGGAADPEDCRAMRGGADTAAIRAMTLEHYPGMTEKMLAEIEAEANRRWPLQASLVIHRFGTLSPGERIVLVACAAAHREDAIRACSFLIDWLKTKAPFWKLEDTAEGPRWVAAKAADDVLAARWLKK